MPKLPEQPKESLVYEDEKLYICLASKPFAFGHTVVVWKKDIEDLHLLSCEDYDYLMDVTDALRDALLRTFKVKKVYMLYMDELKHVHWHLIPRFKVQGFKLFLHPNRTSKQPIGFPLVEKIKENFLLVLTKHPELGSRKTPFASRKHTTHQKGDP